MTRKLNKEIYYESRARFNSLRLSGPSLPDEDALDQTHEQPDTDTSVKDDPTNRNPDQDEVDDENEKDAAYAAMPEPGPKSPHEMMMNPTVVLDPPDETLDSTNQIISSLTAKGTKTPDIKKLSRMSQVVRKGMMGQISYAIEQQGGSYFGSATIDGDWLSSPPVASPYKAEMDIRNVITQKVKGTT